MPVENYQQSNEENVWKFVKFSFYSTSTRLWRHVL